MSNKKRSKHIIADIGAHCQTLVDDFFNFTEGNIDDVKVITELRDIREPMPPQVEQIRKMLARCDRVWKEYCDFTAAPRETRKLFINRVKKIWLSLENKQAHKIPVRKRGEGEGQA